MIVAGCSSIRVKGEQGLIRPQSSPKDVLRTTILSASQRTSGPTSTDGGFAPLLVVQSRFLALESRHSIAAWVETFLSVPANVAATGTLRVTGTILTRIQPLGPTSAAANRGKLRVGERRRRWVSTWIGGFKFHRHRSGKRRTGAGSCGCHEPSFNPGPAGNADRSRQERASRQVGGDFRGLYPRKLRRHENRWSACSAGFWPFSSCRRLTA